MTIHWCGTGLSSVPGLRRLLEEGREVAVWNRTLEEARAAVGDLTARIAVLEPGALRAALMPGDILVSMYPSDWHQRLAELALSRGAHFISSSYETLAMRALDAAARAAGVAVVNEVGLDPGIDHLMAHRLVADYRASPAFAPDNVLSFQSLCGGLPKEPNALRYKFSWSPVGVLKALRAPSRSIRNFTELEMARPWEALTRYDAPAPLSETFEVYPNRDSLPYRAEYGFEPAWRVRDFVRGTLRLNGWADAWAGSSRNWSGRAGTRRRCRRWPTGCGRATRWPPKSRTGWCSACRSRPSGRGGRSGTGPGRSTPGATCAARPWRGSCRGPWRWRWRRSRRVRFRRECTGPRRTRGWCHAGSRPSTRWRSGWSWWITSPDGARRRRRPPPRPSPVTGGGRRPATSGPRPR
jgi:hypothetical protein